MAFRFYFSAHKQQQRFPHPRYNLQLYPGITHVFISTCDGQLESTVTLTQLQAPHNGPQSSPAWLPADLLLLWVKLHMPVGKLLVIQGFTTQYLHSTPHLPIQVSRSGGNEHLGMSSNYCRLTPERQKNTITQKNLPIPSHTIHVQIP